MKKLTKKEKFLLLLLGVSLYVILYMAIIVSKSSAAPLSTGWQCVRFGHTADANTLLTESQSSYRFDKLSVKELTEPDETQDRQRQYQRRNIFTWAFKWTE